MAITSILDLQLRADSPDKALEIINATLADTRAFPGCLGVTVLVDSSDPMHVVLYETWESAEADAAYREWRAGGGGASQLPSIMASPPKLSMFTVAEGVLRHWTAGALEPGGVAVAAQ